MAYEGVGSFSLEGERYSTMLRLSVSSMASFLRRPLARPLTLTLVLIGLLAVGLDAYTTLAMMSSDLTEEGNQYAAHGMAWMGREAYVAFASLESMAFVGLLLVRGKGLARYALPAFALAFVAWKLYTGIDNVLLWRSLIG